MTLSDLERLAREATPGKRVSITAADFLAFVRLGLAAEPWRAEIARKPRPTDAEVKLATAIDALAALNLKDET